jgi:hypothetical protein
MRNILALDEKDICGSAPRVGRRMEFPDKCIAPLAKGTFARIAATLQKDEDRTDFIREAVERELERRAKGSPKSPGQ